MRVRVKYYSYTFKILTGIDQAHREKEHFEKWSDLKERRPDI